MEEQKSCPQCQHLLLPTDYFCPNCGKKIKEPPVSTTVAKQIGIYAVSVLLPPLGLKPGIHYLMQSDQKAKTIGIVALILTIISTFLSIWAGVAFMSSISNTLSGQLNTQIPGL